MDASLEAFSRAVAAIHEAAAAPERWQSALTDIAALLQASKGSLFDLQIGAQEILGFTAVGHDAGVQKEYVEHYHAVDPTLRLAFDHAEPQPLVVYETFSASFRARDEYFDFARRADIGDVIAITADLPDSPQRTLISLQRPYDAPHYDEEAKCLIALLIPHLQLAKQVQTRLAQAAARQDMLSAGLDRFAAAAFILDASGVIRHANAAGRQLFGASRMLRVTHGKLSLREPRLDDEFVTALRQATDKNPRSSLLPLPANRGNATELTVSPLAADHAMAAAWREPLALVVVAMPASDPQAIARRACVLYGLTTAEARVMALIALGESVENIALTHGVRTSTVRAQLRSIFGKTGTSRQSDLVRLALGGVSFINPPA